MTLPPQSLTARSNSQATAAVRQIAPTPDTPEEIYIAQYRSITGARQILPGNTTGLTSSTCIQRRKEPRTSKPQVLATCSGARSRKSEARSGNHSQCFSDCTPLKEEKPTVNRKHAWPWLPTQEPEARSQ